MERERAREIYSCSEHSSSAIAPTYINISVGICVLGGCVKIVQVAVNAHVQFLTALETDEKQRTARKRNIVRLPIQRHRENKGFSVYARLSVRNTLVYNLLRPLQRYINVLLDIYTYVSDAIYVMHNLLFAAPKPPTHILCKHNNAFQ